MKTDQVKVENEVHEYRKYLVLKNFQPSTVDMYCGTLIKSYIIKIMTESIPVSYSDSIKGQKCSRMIVAESKFLPILGSNYRSY